MLRSCEKSQNLKRRGSALPTAVSRCARRAQQAAPLRRQKWGWMVRCSV